MSLHTAALALVLPLVGAHSAVATTVGDCILGVPSGTRVTATADGGALIAYVDGREENVAPCAATPSARTRARGQPGPPVWKNWPEHLWFGKGFADFTNPRLPANESIAAMYASWTVPPLPTDRSGNASDPWSQAAPTESWWIGLQGPAVLQPVLELNGLRPGVFDAVSWNCCPAGFAWHSPSIAAFPGDIIDGSIVRLPDTADGAFVYETVTSVTSPSTGTLTVRLQSAMGGEAGWAPTWAEVVVETYYVTSCDRLPCGSTPFTNLSVWTSPAQQPYTSSSVPTRLATLPWSTQYEVAGAAPLGLPICGGAASSDNSTFVELAFDCHRAP